MSAAAEKYGHTVMLHLKGDLSADTLEALKKSVEHNLADKDIIDVALNLEQVTFIDSAGLEYLLDLQDRLAERLGQVKLIKPEEHVRKILEITRLSPIFEVYQDVQEAVKALAV